MLFWKYPSALSRSSALKGRDVKFAGSGEDRRDIAVVELAFPCGQPGTLVVSEHGGKQPGEIVCQWPPEIPHRRSWIFPRDGHGNSPRTAMGIPQGRPRCGLGSVLERLHPLPRCGVCKSHRLPFGDNDVGMMEQPVH